MMFKTHLMFGILLGVFVVKYFSLESGFWFTLVCGFFAILPDIDFHKSKIGMKVKPLSWLINVFLGHRGLIHSFLMAFILYALFFIMFGGVWGVAAFLGYNSHIFLDSFTKKGTKPFWPLKIRISGILKGNGTIDYFLFFLFLVGTFLLLV